MKVLFVCCGNVNRSPTFERYFKRKYKDYEVRSCGTHYGYPYQLDKSILKWADKIFAMDLSQEQFINNNYPEYMDKVETIGISDQYNPDDLDLIGLIKYWEKKKKFKG